MIKKRESKKGVCCLHLIWTHLYILCSLGKEALQWVKGGPKIVWKTIFEDVSQTKATYSNSSIYVESFGMKMVLKMSNKPESSEKTMGETGGGQRLSQVFWLWQEQIQFLSQVEKRSGNS